MNAEAKPAPEAIRQARAENPKMRERDLASQLGITEADLVAAHVGHGVRRVEPRVEEVLRGLTAVGEVMALTRNDSAVHEKIGVYDKIGAGRRAIVVLNGDIDLRIFPEKWAHGFAVEKSDGEAVRRSLQFFDRAGNAVHKIHLRPTSDVDAYERLVTSLLAEDQRQTLETAPLEKASEEDGEPGSVDELRERWDAITDVHQFSGILRSLKLKRRQALGMVGEDYAWQLDGDAVTAMFHAAVQDEVPIMCFVGNESCIQIHSGPVKNIKPMGPWINVLDETFHLHLRLDHVREVWGVRKPTKDGHVTSVEVFDANHDMIIQFFGKRLEGKTERPDWRTLVENLPRVARSTAA